MSDPNTTWKDVLHGSSATREQRELIESMVDTEIARWSIRLLSAQNAHAKCMGEWAEWIEHLYSDLDGVRCSLRGGDAKNSNN
jgi:hypothetical protein